jgi:hypothetical protein
MLYFLNMWKHWPVLKMDPSVQPFRGETFKLAITTVEGRQKKFPFLLGSGSLANNGP